MKKNNYSTPTLEVLECRAKMAICSGAAGAPDITPAPGGGGKPTPAGAPAIGPAQRWV